MDFRSSGEVPPATTTVIPRSAIARASSTQPCVVHALYANLGETCITAKSGVASTAGNASRARSGAPWSQAARTSASGAMPIGASSRRLEATVCSPPSPKAIASSSARRFHAGASGSMNPIARLPAAHAMNVGRSPVCTQIATSYRRHRRAARLTVAHADIPSGTAITSFNSGFPRSTPSVPENTSMSMRASGHAARMERATGVASNTSPMRRMQITSTLFAAAMSARCVRRKISIDAQRGAHAIGTQQLVEALLVLGELASIALAVPEVEHGRGEAGGLLAHAGAIEADHEVGILESPARERLVQSGHAPEILAPHGHVAGLHALPSLRHVPAKPPVRQAHEREPPVDVAAQPRAQPLPARPAMHGHLRGEDLPREVLAQQQATAGEERAALGGPLVRRDEVRRRNAVTVVEDEGVGARRRGGAVADRRQAKALVLVPHVRDPEGRPLRERLPHGARLGRGAVVGHDELEIEIILREESFEHGGERIGAVVGGDDDRGAHQPFFSSRSMSFAYR